MKNVRLTALKNTLGRAGKAMKAEVIAARQTAAWVDALPKRARRAVLADPEPGPAPDLPNPAQIMAEARKRATRVAAVTAGVTTWRETADLYRKYRSGEEITAASLWGGAQRVGQRTAAASKAANRRYLTVVALNTAAKVVAWQSAGRAATSPVWKVIHVGSKKLAGRAGLVLTAVDVFVTMRNDLERFRGGELDEDDFMRNCALTGVTLLAPMVGASAGPVGATVGLGVAIGAGMARK